MPTNYLLFSTMVYSTVPLCLLFFLSTLFAHQNLLVLDIDIRQSLFSTSVLFPRLKWIQNRQSLSNFEDKLTTDFDVISFDEPCD